MKNSSLGSKVLTTSFAAAALIVSGFFVSRANAQMAPEAALGVTQITAVQTYAAADNTYADGWKWVFDVTVPQGQTLLKMKFADWSGTLGNIPAADNIQFYSAQSLNAPDEANTIPITGAGAWSGIMTLNPAEDLNVMEGGQQIEITVEARVPVGTPGGSYSTSYGINTTATSTVTLGDLTQTYDSTAKTVTVTTDPSGLANSVTYNGSATAPTDAGSYTIVATVTDPGYTGSATGTLLVNPAAVTVTADTLTKVYGSSDPALTYGVAPALFDADAFTGALTRDPGENVGTYTITQGTLALNGNYAMTFVTSTLTITPQTVTVTLGNLSQTYGSTSAVTATTTVTGLPISITYDDSPTVPTNAGSYDVVATVTDPNYSGSATGTLVVSPLPITVTAVTDTKTYDGTISSNGVPTITSGALVDGDAPNWIQTFDTKDVGTGKTLTPSGTVTDGNSGNNYAVTFVPVTDGVINPAPATVTASGVGKIYDGTTAANVVLSVDGAVGGDILTVADTATFDTKDVGVGKTVTVTGITVSGTNVAPDDYAYNTTAIATADITPAPLTITANDAAKTYGDTKTFAGTEFTSSGLLDGDSIASVTFASDGAVSTAQVGSYPIVPTDAQGTGLDNYAITYQNGSLAVNAGALTATITAENKQYDGTDAATVGDCSLTGVVAGDTVTCSAMNAAFSDKNVGTGKTVTADITLSGTDAGNYTVISPVTTTADITPLAITVTAVTDTKIYDGMTSSSKTPVISSGTLVNSDSVTWTQAFASKDVGTDISIVPSGTVNDGNGGNNYAVTFVDATGTITSAQATVTAIGQDKVYDGTTAAAVTLNVTGAVPGDTLTAADTATFDTEDVGTGKVVTVTGITLSGTGVTPDDYTYNTTATTTASITQKALTIVGLTVNDKVYDASTTATLGGTPTLSGVVQGDDGLVTLDSSGVTASFVDPNVGQGKPVTLTGEYTISGAKADDYSLTQPTGLMGNITPLGITGTITADGKVYDGTTAVASTSCQLTGVLDGDTANVSCVVANAQFNTKNVGTDTVSADLNLTGSEAGNYAVNSPATITATITPLAITVTAQPNTKVYDGMTNAAAVPTVSPSVATGDTANFIETYDTADVGTSKTLTPSGNMNDGNGGSNYTYSFEPNTAGVITRASQTITIVTSSIPNGPIAGNTFTLEATTTSGLPVTFTGGTSGVCSVSSGGTVTIESSGSCTVTAIQAGNTDYNPAPAVTDTFAVQFYVTQTSTPANLVLTAPLTVTVSSSTSVVPETGGVPTNGSSSVVAAIAGTNPIAVELQNTGSVDYPDNVRIEAIGANANIQFWAVDSVGNWYDINVTGWGPPNGFPMSAGYGATTDVYVISNAAGSYPVTINVVDASTSAIVASASGTITVQ